MAELLDRIQKNARHLRKWAKRQGYTCLRLYDHDIPQYRLCVDDYEGRFLITLSKGQLLPEELQSLGPLVIKDRVSQQNEQRLEDFFVVQEGDLRFEINLRAYQDTGLFLDHRLLRSKIRHASLAGKKVLNLFCYTGSFSVAAAKAGANVTSLDLSNTYLSWAQRNFSLNSLELAAHQFVRADVLQWLPTAIAAGHQYDLIICDPPTFSNSKKSLHTFDLQKVHAALLTALQQLSPTIYFSCNDRGFKMQLDWTEITPQTRSEDFKRGGGHRCWLWGEHPKAHSQGPASSKGAQTSPSTSQAVSQSQAGLGQRQVKRQRPI